MKTRQQLLIITLLVFSLAACAPTQIPASGLSTAAVTQAPVQPTSVKATNPTEVKPTDPPSPGAASSDGIVYEIIPDQSKANYRVTEQLVNNDLPNDAVGVTSGISGSVIVLADGTIDKTKSKFSVDLSSLQSDKSMRDNFVKRNILDTAQYPNAVFVPTEVKGLPSPIPQSGSVTFQVVGDLTIKGVTKPVIWDVTGAINNGIASGKATTAFKFEDFNLSQPKVPVVLSVVDKITLEIEVAMKPAGS
jgi:polyisoprenoid-binding protein YceI